MVSCASDGNHVWNCPVMWTWRSRRSAQREAQKNSASIDISPLAGRQIVVNRAGRAASMARMTVAARVTLSPWAKTPSRVVRRLSPAACSTYSRRARWACALVMSATRPMMKAGCWRTIAPVAASLNLRLKCPSQLPDSLVGQSLWYRMRAELQVSECPVKLYKSFVLFYERE